MHHEFNTYAFQLQEGSISTSISSHPKQPIFYTSAISQNQQSKSFLYSLKYSEENPRKSQLFTHTFSKHLTGIYSFKEDGLMLTFSGEIDEIGVLAYKFEGTEHIEEEVKVGYKSEDRIQKIVKKNQNEGVVCTDNKLKLIDFNTLEEKQQIFNLQNGSIGHCAVDPIHEYLTYTQDNQIFIFDKNCEKQKYSFKLSHNIKQDIQGIDYNPNKQYYLMTAHSDYLKFWDIRKGNIPVKCIDDHHSLILSAHYNHSHDELLIISYDDGTVGLQRISSVSSAPSGQREDALVNLYDEHEDSVYKAEWSGFSPWIFGSVSYGAANLVVNTVSQAEKFRILL